MKLPEGYSISCNAVLHEGIFRPKDFIEVSLTKENGDTAIGSQYVVARPFLLRLRLALAVRRLVRMYKKYEQFGKRHS